MGKLWGGVVVLLLVGALVGLSRCGAGHRPARPQSGVPAEVPALGSGSIDPVAVDASPREKATPAQTLAPDPVGGAMEVATFVAADVYGRVLTPTDEPVSGARVVLFAGQVPDLGPPVAETRTDGQGNFRIPEVGACRLLALHASREGFLPKLQPSAASGQYLEIRLTEAHGIRGRVFDALTGDSVPGALVSTRRSHWNGTSYTDRQVVQSGSHGEYTLDWIGLEGDVTIWAHREGEGAEPFQFHLSPERRDGYDLALGSARPLILDVVDATTGARLPGLRIEVDWHAPVATDGEGRLLLPFPSSSVRRYGTIVLQAEGYCCTHVPLTVEEERVRVPMLAAASLGGRVLDPNGAPCDRATIKLAGAVFRRKLETDDGEFTLSPAWRPVLTGVDGRFLAPCRMPQPELIRVAASLEGFQDSEPVEVSLKDSGSHAEVQLQLRHGAALSGTVRKNGQAVSAILHWTRGDLRGKTRSNDAGEYHMAGLPRGELTLRILDKGEWLYLDVEISSSHVERDLDFYVQQEAIAGVLLHADGSPAADQDVYAFERHASLVEGGRTKSLEDGSFLIHVAANEGIAYEVHGGRGAARAVQRDVPAGSQDLRLQLVAVAELSLEIRDEVTQEVLPRCDIWWRRSETEELVRVHRLDRSLAPGPTGQYTIEVPQGRIDLAVESREYGYARTWVEGVEVSDRTATTPLWVHLERDPPGK